ncbi:MAG TPA: hypothetical protein VI756_18105 [Blastocatellia bacterium]
MNTQALPLSAYAPKKAVPIRQAMNIQAPGPSADAPTKSDPIRLAGATIQAVDRIGEATSEEIQRAADEIMRGATEIAEKLGALANAIREHSKIAHEHITKYCDSATSVLEGVRDLQAKLEVSARKTETQEVRDDRSIVPAFFRQGPAEWEDHKL